MKKNMLIGLSALLIIVVAVIALIPILIPFITDYYPDSLINMFSNLFFSDLFDEDWIVFLTLAELALASHVLISFFIKRSFLPIFGTLFTYICISLFTYIFDDNSFFKTLAGLSYLQNSVLFLIISGFIMLYVESTEEKERAQEARRAKAKQERIALEREEEQKRIMKGIIERQEKAEKERKAQEKEKRLKDLCGDTEQWQQYIDGEICMGMHFELVADLHGKGYMIKKTATKNSEKITTGFEAYRTSRGQTKFELEVTFENDRVIAWKALPRY